MKRYIAIFVILFLLAGVMPVRALTNEDERKYGKEIFLEIARSTPINNDPYISFYLDSIKKNIESKTVMPFPVVLTVIDSSTIDAFATIGGYVYLAAGLIANCDSEDEAAGVMAHEFAHIKKRHIAKRMDKQKYMNATMVATMLAAMLAGDAAREAILVAGMGASQTMALKYSREDEEEADREGSLLANNAGYGGLGISDFLKKLRATGGEKLYPQYLLTHPYSEDRIINLEKTWKRKPPSTDPSLFPYIIARTKLMLGYRATGLTDEVWLKRYARDSKDPVTAYGAALHYSLKGRYEESIKIVRNIQSPYKNLFLGEIYVSARKFPEAVEALRNVNEPVGLYFLARAYEGMGSFDTAVDTFKALASYAPSYPDIYYRLGMILGRTGDEAAGHAYLGRYYMNKGNYALAKTNFEKAIAKYGINSRESTELMRLLDTVKEPS